MKCEHNIYSLFILFYTISQNLNEEVILAVRKWQGLRYPREWPRFIIRTDCFAHRILRLWYRLQ